MCDFTNAVCAPSPLHNSESVLCDFWIPWLGHCSFSKGDNEGIIKMGLIVSKGTKKPLMMIYQYDPKIKGKEEEKSTDLLDSNPKMYSLCLQVQYE
jgi:hypothetical protein